MRRIVVELTDRCGLRCLHCFSGRHGGTRDLSESLFARVLPEARACGFDEIAFTGGEPTSHPSFARMLALAAEHEFHWGMVTHGWTFRAVLPHVLAHRDRLTAVTFSMDGASPATHDQLRGEGAFRRVLQAVALAVASRLPFTINMVVTRYNRQDLQAMTELAADLGAGGLRFGHVLGSHDETITPLDGDERRQVECEITRLAATARIPVGMAPGAYTVQQSPCAPLGSREVNIDSAGNLTACCHLSGHACGPGAESAGNLGDLSFAAAWERIEAERARFRQRKSVEIQGGHFPCDYCAAVYGKVPANIGGVRIYASA